MSSLRNLIIFLSIAILVVVLLPSALAHNTQESSSSSTPSSSGEEVQKKNYNDDPSFTFDPHPFRYIFTDFFKCDGNVTAIRTFLVVLLSTAKTKEAKLALVAKQKDRFLDLLINSSEELKTQPQRVEEHKKEFEKLTELIFSVELETGKVCQYVYDTVFTYDQTKLGRKVVNSMEEYKKAVEEEQERKKKKIEEL